MMKKFLLLALLFSMAAISTSAQSSTSIRRRVTDERNANVAGAENLFAARYYENGFRAPGFVARGGVNLRFR